MGPKYLLPTVPGRDATTILLVLLGGGLDGAVANGTDLCDFPDSGLAHMALVASGFIVQLEACRSEVSKYADVVLSVALAVEGNDTFVNWEGYVRPSGQTYVSCSCTDRQVLGMFIDEVGIDLQVDNLVVLRE